MSVLEKIKLAIIGLGYVGLPLALELGEKRSVVGFDITSTHINALRAERDSTLEVSDEELMQTKDFSCTANLDDLKDCNVFIVTVPTPINEQKQPDLTPLIKASESIGYKSEIILSVRRLNDSIGEYVVSQLVKAMLKNAFMCKVRAY